MTAGKDRKIKIMEIKLLNKKINKIIDNLEKKKSEEIIALLETSLPKKILDFDLKKVELFDLAFGDYIANYNKKNNKIKISLMVSIPSDTNIVFYNLCVYDYEGADYSLDLKKLSDVDKVASQLVEAYKNKD